MKKVAAIIQARTTSERLPQKVLAVLKGKRVIEHVLDAIKNARLVDEIILATTTNKEDDVLAEIAHQHHVGLVRGDEHDVLSRFTKATEISSADVFIRFTADDPLLDPNVIDAVVGYFLKNDFDYVSNIIDRSWPRGLDTEVFSRDALIRSATLAKESEYKEHVTLYMRMHPENFTQQNVVALAQETMPDTRLCIDTEEDYELLKAVFDALYEDGKIVRVGAVVDWLKKHPEVANLNAGTPQKPVFGKVF